MLARPGDTRAAGPAACGAPTGGVAPTGGANGTRRSVSPTDVFVAECTSQSCVGSVPGRYHSVYTTGSGQYGLANIPVVLSMSREISPSGRGQSGGVGFRR